MDHKLTWEQPTYRYGSGQRAKLGKWIVGGYHWNATRAKGDKENLYSVTCNLPGIKDTSGTVNTEEEAKALIERTVAHWVKEAGLTTA